METTSPTGTPVIPPNKLPWIAGAMVLMEGLVQTAELIWPGNPKVAIAGRAALYLGILLGQLSPGWRRKAE